MKKRVRICLSLVELTLLSVSRGFCLLAVFGLMPIGVQTNRNATSQTAATNVIAAVVANMRATPIANNSSRQFAVEFGTDTTRYFDSQAQCSCDSAGLQKPNPSAGDCSLSWSPTLQPRYRLTITWNGSSSLRYAGSENHMARGRYSGERHWFNGNACCL